MTADRNLTADDKIEIRLEHEGDSGAIRDIVRKAFGREEEAALVDALRESGAARLSIVAADGGRIVAHAMLSEMRAPSGALGLAPVSVAPDYQGRGVGTALIGATIEWARAQGCQALIVLGEPDYYRRFGFEAAPLQGFSSPYAGPHLMGLELREGSLSGNKGDVVYAAAFDAFS